MLPHRSTTMYIHWTIERLRRADLLSRDSLMNTPHQNTLNRMLSLQAQVEPIRDFKIDLNASQNYQSREEYYYKYMSAWDEVEGPLSYVMTGSYSTTCWSLATAFMDDSILFDNFLANRSIVAGRLAAANPDPMCDQMVRDTMVGLLLMNSAVYIISDIVVVY